MIDVLDRVEVREPDDVLTMLPPLPSDPFSTRQLAAQLGCSVPLAQRAAYCLRAMGVIETASKRGRTPLHQRRLEATAGN